MLESEVHATLPGKGWSNNPVGEADSPVDTDPMNALLGAISRMMAESESRQSAALHDMQERISKLAANARGTTDRLPEEFQGAFQQIEEAMEQLAAKINGATGSASPEHPNGSQAASNVSDHISTFLEHEEKPAQIEEKKLASLADHFIRQSLQPEAAQAQVATASAAVEPALDHPTAQPVAQFDDAGNPDDPWDEIAAEQLTQLYESGEAGLPHAIGQPFQFIETPLAHQPAQPAPIAPAAPLVDEGEQRAWFEENFNRIIAHIETSSASDDDSEVDHIELLGQRLEQMESRLQGAMDSLPKNTDLAAIQDIESCIVEFTAQLERSQSELDRIAEVEALVQGLAERLSEDRLSEFTRQQEVTPPSIDGEQIAELVAQHVSEVTTGKLISAMPEPEQINTEELSEVKGLVNNLIAEQRNGGRQTTERLDLLQQATLQLLERLEKVESTQEGMAKDVANLPTAFEETPIASSKPVLPSQEENTRAAERAIPSLNTPLEPAPRPAAPTLDREPEIAEGNPEPQPTPERPNRNNFVAEARRAAARANQRAANELGGNVVEDSDYGDSQDDLGNGVDTKKAPRSSRARLAIAAVALAVVGLGAGNFFLNMNKGAPSKTEQTSNGGQPAKIETAPGKSSATGIPAKPQLQAPRQDSGLAIKRAVASAQDGVPIGVTLEKASDEVPAAVLARQERQQELAVLSTKTGATQPTADAVPASLIPRDEQPAGRRITGSHSQLSKDMPPALVGPLSLRLAAASGNPSATFEVGARFAEGKGVRQNFKEAAQWYAKSATRGFALAQYRLATLYERGLGVEKDLSRAKIWYERAARQGNVKSMHNLAVLTAGSGTGKSDYGQAARWFTEAAERGLADSQFNLAILYQNGLGVSKDLKQAYQWFGLAARAGDKDADARRKGLISEMQPAELTQADSSIAQWRRKAISRLANDSHYAGVQWKKQKQSNARQN